MVKEVFWQTGTKISFQIKWSFMSDKAKKTKENPEEKKEKSKKEPKDKNIQKVGRQEDEEQEDEKIEVDLSDNPDTEDISIKIPLSRRIKRFFRNPKKRKIFYISITILILVIFGIGFYLMNRDTAVVSSINNNPEETKAEATKPITYESPLDGILVEDETITKKHPVAIVVENHTDARPQAGLDKASIVYEALAEGGITRFLGLYSTYEAEKVGPVRSARTYFVDWAHGYNAFFAHVGGNMDALDKIPVDKVLDLDQFKYSAAYWRERSSSVASEHTMFTSTAKLRDQATKNNYSTANNFSTYKFKNDESAENRPESQNITINYSNENYKVKFVYDKESNSYKRYMGGKLHTDRVTKENLMPKNIIVMTVTQQPTVTRINEPGLTMGTIGEGKALIYIDGEEIKGTWKKQSADTREMFFDESGKEITFNRGQFWISVVPSGTKPVVE